MQVSGVAARAGGWCGWVGVRRPDDLPEGYHTTARGHELGGGWPAVASRTCPRPPGGRALPGRDAFYELRANGVAPAVIGPMRAKEAARRIEEALRNWGVPIRYSRAKVATHFGVAKALSTTTGLSPLTPGRVSIASPPPKHIPFTISLPASWGRTARWQPPGLITLHNIE